MVVAAPVTPRLRHPAAQQSEGEIQHSNDCRHWTEIQAVVTLVPGDGDGPCLSDPNIPRSQEGPNIGDDDDIRK